MNEQANTKEHIMAQWFENFYECPECNTKWLDRWSCMCNDRCPECDVETQPMSSLDLSRPLTAEDYIGAGHLIADSRDAKPADVTDNDARYYAEAMLEGGEHRFHVRRAYSA